ncbi:MAG: hypothetical protein O3A63_12425, partial [Proteobacteria bacterium]|nr:hypothetical protein [Pseudomonadota bacterium]
MNRWLALILCLTAPIAGLSVPVAFDNEDLLELQREQSKRRPAGSALASLTDAIDSSSQASNHRYADDRFDDGQGIATPTYWRPADSA